jgi:hypothetical protein
MTKFFVHIFTGMFPDENSAVKYCQPSYDDDGDATCSFWEDLGGVYLDEDFVEVIHGEDRFDYVERMILEDTRDMVKLQKCVKSEDTSIVLVMELESNKGLEVPRDISGPLRYCGRLKGYFRSE